MSATILSVDQSLTASGAVLLRECDKGKLELVDQWAHRPKSTGIHRVVSHRNWLISLIERSDKPDYLARELHYMRQFGAAAALQHLSALIDLIAYEDDYLDDSRYATVGPGTWKKFVAGNGSIKKDKKYVKTMVDAVHAHPMFQGDISDISDDNIIDAICIGVTAFAAIRGYARVTEMAPFIRLMEDSPKICDYGKER